MQIDSTVHPTKLKTFTLFLKITHRDASWNGSVQFSVQKNPLPEIAYGLGGLENPDFPIKIRIFHSSACGVYFRDLLV